jgi:hypothetical protein
MSYLDTAYVILGLPVGTPLNQVNKTYHRLALKHHPDKNNGKHSEVFQDILTAYTFIKNYFNPSMNEVPPIPPPRPPPRPQYQTTPPPRPQYQAPSPPRPQYQPQRNTNWAPDCKHGIKCYYFGCKFTHPIGHRIPDSPIECRFGWNCCNRGFKCKFLHTRIIIKQEGRMELTIKESIYNDINGKPVMKTTITTKQVY